MTLPLISIDLWNTLIHIDDANIIALSEYIAATSPLKDHEVYKHIIEVGERSDMSAIAVGTEIPSMLKIQEVLKEVNSSRSVNQIQDFLEDDLLRLRPPIPTEPDLLTTLRNLPIRFVVASNSGFVHASLARRIIHHIGIADLPNFEAAYFSEEIGYAKPNALFFAPIIDAHGSLAWHIGDSLRSDGAIPPAVAPAILYCPVSEPLKAVIDHQRIIRQFRELREYL